MSWVAVALVLVGSLVGALLAAFLSGRMLHAEAVSDLAKTRDKELKKYTWDYNAINQLPAEQKAAVLQRLGEELNQKIEPALSGPKRRIGERAPLASAGAILSIGAIPVVGALAAEPLAQHLTPVGAAPLFFLGLASLVCAGVLPGVSVVQFALLGAAGWALAAFGPELEPGALSLVYAAAAACLLCGIGSVALSSRRAGAIGLALGDGRKVSWHERVTPTKPSYHLSGYKCGKCSGSLPGKVAVCPHCGARFGGTRSVYDKPPPGPIIVRTDDWPVERSARTWSRWVVIPAAAALLTTPLLGGPWSLRAACGGGVLAAVAALNAYTRRRGATLAGSKKYGEVSVTKDIGTYDHELSRDQVLAKYGG